jgi:hypothetical protein
VTDGGTGSATELVFVGLVTDNVGSLTDLKDLMYLRGGSKVTISSSVFCERSKNFSVESESLSRLDAQIEGFLLLLVANGGSSRFLTVDPRLG